MNPFTLKDTEGRRWLKGNLHTHTTNSDGTRTVEERIAEYAGEGYGFLSITDHHTITEIDGYDVPEGLTLIPGVELHPQNPFGGPMFHFLAHGVTKNVPVDGRSPQFVLDAVREQGGTVWLAHPYWNDIVIERDVRQLTGLAGLEIYNTTCARYGRGESGVHWDQWMQLLDAPVPCIATDDAHTREKTDGDDRFQGFTWVYARSNEPSDILAALFEGMSYSSTGPELRNVSVERVAEPPAASRPIRVTVESSPVVRVTAICDAFGADYPLGPSSSEFKSADFWVRDSKWVRVEVIDRLGQKAWTNPIAVAD